ncbi:MAG: hypothetical protein WC438_03150 [Candidatus Pacearchaeota archaeon]
MAKERLSLCKCEWLNNSPPYESEGRTMLHDIGHRAQFELSKIYICALTEKPCIGQVVVQDRKSQLCNSDSYRVNFNIELHKRCPRYSLEHKADQEK